MQKGEPSPQENQNLERRRRSQSKYNKDLPRYECFCAKQYLSYPALYLHMKNKHIDYFQSSKSGRVEPTKLIESFNPAQGYKVYKIAGDSIHKELYTGKYYEQGGFMDNSKPSYYLNSNGNYMRFPNMAYHQNYGYMMNGNNQNQDHRTLQKEAVIQIALSMYMQTLKDKPFKQRHQTQLFFVMLVDCLNRNYQILKDTRAEAQQVRRYTAEYNCQKLMGILPYFQTQYLPSMIQPSKPTSFFVKYSHIITSGEYKNVLGEFISYVYDKQPKSTVTSNIIQAPQPPFSENEGQSDDPSRNDEVEDDEDEDGDDEDENFDDNEPQS